MLTGPVLTGPVLPTGRADRGGAEALASDGAPQATRRPAPEPRPRRRRPRPLPRGTGPVSRDGPEEAAVPPGDRVATAEPRPGALCDVVRLSTEAPEWSFGTGAPMRDLAGRGLLAP